MWLQAPASGHVLLGVGHRRPCPPRGRGRRPRHKGRRKGCRLRSPHPPLPPSRMSGCGRSQAFWVAQRREVKHTVSHRAPPDTPAQPQSIRAHSVCAQITTWRRHKPVLQSTHTSWGCQWPASQLYSWKNARTLVSRGCALDPRRPGDCRAEGSDEGVVPAQKGSQLTW